MMITQIASQVSSRCHLASLMNQSRWKRRLPHSNHWNRRIMGLVILVGGSMLSTPADGEVSVLLSPTTLSPNVATDVTISFRNETDFDLEIVAVMYEFAVPVGLELNSFVWLSELDSEPDWVHTEQLPRPQTASASAANLSIGPGASEVVSRVRITAEGSAAGGVLTFGVMPEGTDAGIVHGLSQFRELEIVSGRTVQLTVSASSGDGGGDGSGGGGGGEVGGGGGGGGGDGGSDVEAPDDGSPGEGLPDDGGEESGIGDEAGNGGEDVGGSDGSLDDGDMEGGTTDDDDGDDVENPDAADGQENGSESGGETEDDAMEPIGVPPGMGLCGVAMIPTMLFTLCGLSVMRDVRVRKMNGGFGSGRVDRAR